MRNTLWGALVVLALLGAPALASDAAGTAKGVNPAAAARRDGAVQTLVVGSDIFIGDLVQTGDKGIVQILFADNTRLVVGSNSSLKIEDYLLRNDGSAGKMAVDMLGGTFRFATGNAAKSRYEIDTPTATIGVRGTEGDFFVTDDVTLVMVSGGAFKVCVKGTEDCKVVEGLCTLGQVDTASTIVGDTNDITGLERAKLKGEFPFIDNESQLQRIFRFIQGYGCLHKSPDANAPVDAGITKFKPAPPPKGRRGI